ncbi:MAG: prenyltransferase [Christensenellales bacterium]|jgi:1,4-dihydroxy-2-naphthoate octaprenyltransferase
MNNRQSTLIKGLIQVADPKIWIASVIPLLTGGALAWTFGVNTKSLSPLWFLLAMIGVFLVETAKNALNEVVDYQSGVDPGVDEEHRTPFSGGKKSIVNGLLDLTQCLYFALICFFLASVIGVCLTIFVEPKIFWIGLAGFTLAIVYSLPPFKLCYRGFGEFAVGISFGPITVMGIYVLIEGQFAWLPLLISLPIAFLITNVLWINQYPDYEVDKIYNKRNWVVRLGKKKGVWIYAALFAISYLSEVAVAIYCANFIWLLPLITAPIAIKAVKNCYAHYGDIKRLTASNAATVKIYQLFGLSFIICSILDGKVF